MGRFLMPAASLLVLAASLINAIPIERRNIIKATKIMHPLNKGHDSEQADMMTLVPAQRMDKSMEVDGGYSYYNDDLIDMDGEGDEEGDVIDHVGDGNEEDAGEDMIDEEMIIDDVGDEDEEDSGDDSNVIDLTGDVVQYGSDESEETEEENYSSHEGDDILNRSDLVDDDEEMMEEPEFDEDDMLNDIVIRSSHDDDEDNKESDEDMDDNNEENDDYATIPKETKNDDDVSIEIKMDEDEEDTGDDEASDEAKMSFVDEIRNKLENSYVAKKIVQIYRKYHPQMENDIEEESNEESSEENNDEDDSEMYLMKKFISFLDKFKNKIKDTYVGKTVAKIYRKHHPENENHMNEDEEDSNENRIDEDDSEMSSMEDDMSFLDMVKNKMTNTYVGKTIAKIYRKHHPENDMDVNEESSDDSMMEEEQEESNDESSDEDSMSPNEVGMGFFGRFKNTFKNRYFGNKIFGKNRYHKNRKPLS